MIVQRLRAILALGGGTLEERADYPRWPYNRSSALLRDVQAAYRAVSGREGKAEAIHAGLECGLFIEKLPGLDAVSLGPELHDIHSVQERLSVASAQRVYELVRELLRRAALGG